MHGNTTSDRFPRKQTRLAEDQDLWPFDCQARSSCRWRYTTVSEQRSCFRWLRWRCPAIGGRCYQPSLSRPTSPPRARSCAGHSGVIEGVNNRSGDDSAPDTAAHHLRLGRSSDDRAVRRHHRLPDRGAGFLRRATGPHHPRSWARRGVVTDPAVSPPHSRRSAPWPASGAARSTSARNSASISAGQGHASTPSRACCSSGVKIATTHGCLGQRSCSR